MDWSMIVGLIVGAAFGYLVAYSKADHECSCAYQRGYRAALEERHT